METLVLVLLILLGLIIGSFFNAVVWRFGRRRSLHGRSQCVHCKKKLAAWELIPLISFLILRGRCSRCKQPISWRYPIVEAATALLPVPLFLVFHATTALLALTALSFVLCLLFLFDARYSLLPDAVTIPGIVIACIAGLALRVPVWSLLLGGCAGAGFFFVQYAVSRGRWIGSGDIRLGALMGFVLGWKLLFVALLLAYLAGGLVGGALIASGKKSWQSTVPFGTFLTAATYVTLLWGAALLAWYQRAVFL